MIGRPEPEQREGGEKVGGLKAWGQSELGDRFGTQFADRNCCMHDDAWTGQESDDAWTGQERQAGCSS